MEDRISDLLLNGDKTQAFNLIVREYSERLYWLVRRMVTVHADADDCLQDIFIKVWNNLDSFQGKSQIYTWLYRIATNETLSFLRRKRLAGFFTDVSSARALSADPYFDGNAAQTALQIAISKLPPKQRLVFSLRYFEEMPYKEMSEMLNTSEGALKASYFQAYNKVSEWVKQQIDK